MLDVFFILTMSKLADGCVIIWVIEGEDLRWANNNGATFRDYRNVALQMFHELKQETEKRGPPKKNI